MLGQTEVNQHSRGKQPNCWIFLRICRFSIFPVLFSLSYFSYSLIFILVLFHIFFFINIPIFSSLQSADTTMRRRAGWCGRPISWRTAAGRVASPRAWVSAPSAFRWVAPAVRALLSDWGFAWNIAMWYLSLLLFLFCLIRECCLRYVVDDFLMRFFQVVDTFFLGIKTCDCHNRKWIFLTRSRKIFPAAVVFIFAFCLQEGNHEGHDFNMFRSQAGGACDCGNSAVMKESG